MKRSILASLFFVFLPAALVPAHAQVAPSANARTFALNAGGFGSVFQPDYAGNGYAQTSPNRLYGLGAYVDTRFNRWLAIEAETRWMRINQYAPAGGFSNGEDTYSIGPMVPIVTIHRFTPYGKFLVGFGTADFLSSKTPVLTYGGGVDYRLSRRWTLRAFDFEYQQWTEIKNATLWPYGGSVGLSYRIF